jgi:zinc protease
LRPTEEGASFPSMALRYALDNGLTVIFEEQHAAKVAAFQVWVRAGSADERPDQAGLAHLHEHMLFKGTAQRGPGEIAQAIESDGGEINAWTSFDQTVYHTVIASPFARTGLDVLADAVRYSAFDPDELRREIEVVCEEIKRGQDMPSRRASQDFFATAYREHPYRRPVIGTEESVRSFTREKVLEFYHRHYTPSNIVVSIVGDLSEAQVREWVEAGFGGNWGRPYGGPPPRAPEPTFNERRFHFRQEEVKEAYLHVGFAIPNALHPQTPALEALAIIAGQGESSRLNLSVRRRLALARSIGAYAYTPMDPGLWAVSMTLGPEEAARALEESLRIVLALREERVPAEELAKVKAQVESEAIYQRESAQGMARKLGFYQSAMGGIEQEAKYYERVAALKPDDLLEAARTYLRPEAAVISALLPTGAAFDETQAEAILDRVARAPRSQQSSVPAPNRASTDSAPSKLRVTAPRGGGQVGKVVTDRLPSGATLVIREERAVPLFGIRAAFHGGLRYETAQNNGLTHLLARMLTRGTRRHDGESLSRILDEMAGSLGGNAGRSSVGLRGEFLSKHFHRGFELFAECLLEPTFAESEFNRERQLMQQAIASREDKPSSVAFELFAKTLYHHHPYRLPALGELSSLESLSPAALHQYRQQFMDPSQLTLAVVGDVNADEVRAVATEYFGKSRAGAVAPPAIPKEPPIEAPRRAKHTLQKAQSHLVLGFPGARIDEPWRYALEVASTVLSGQGGRLFVELRDKKSLAYSVSSFSVEGVDPGYFATYIGTSPEKVTEAAAGMEAELQKLASSRISDAELDRARRNLIGTHEIELQRNSARAAQLALDVCYGLGPDSALHFAERIGAVTAEAVREVAARVIDFKRSAQVEVGP